MFGTLLVKEIHETITTGTFVIAALLCIILIPMGMYITLDDYNQRLSEYNRARQLYEERSEGNVGSSFKAEGYRPPSPLSVFAVGLDPYLPNKAVTSRSGNVFSDKSTVEGIVAVSNSSGLSNPLSVFFGKMDYLFNVAFVLSMFAFVFTFAGITAEKEQGTLKLIMSNRVSRWSLLAAKIAGNFIVFMLPFCIAFVAGVLILLLSGVFPAAGQGMASSVVGMFVISVLFLLCMFILGLLVSSWNRSSIAAIITLLFVWVMLALVVPKLSPMIAQKIHPVVSEEVITQQIRTLRRSIEDEQWEREDELFADVLGRYGLSADQYFEIQGTEQRSRLEAEYDELAAPIREEYAGRLVSETVRVQRDYANELAVQQGIAMQLSRVSPISCFSYLMAAIASTGPGEVDNFTRQAEQFQDQVADEVYDLFEYIRYGTGNGMYNVGFRAKEGVDTHDIPVPHMTGYRFASLAEAFGESWPDLLLLGLYTVLFFAGAFVKFVRYDVR